MDRYFFKMIVLVYILIKKELLKEKKVIIVFLFMWDRRIYFLRKFCLEKYFNGFLGFI